MLNLLKENYVLHTIQLWYNYRPISLTSITCKMLEHIITSNIVQHLDSDNILHDAQHGFRKHRSTETQLIQLIDNLAHNIDNRIQTDAILLDFQKAFDKVPHHRLYKLKYYGRGRPWRYSVIPSTPDFTTEYQIRRHSNPAGLPTFATIWGPDFRASIIRFTCPHV